jgi:hypothetical protein
MADVFIAIEFSFELIISYALISSPKVQVDYEKYLNESGCSNRYGVDFSIKKLPYPAVSMY